MAEKNSDGSRFFDTTLIRKIHAEKTESQEKLRRKKLRKVKQLLKKYFSGKEVKRVYITGSLARQGAFMKRSDIDIAVEGLDHTRYFEVFGELEELLDTEKIDLIEMERCSFSELIEKDGERVL
jgi:predicted nucleotidyltransferase